MWGSVWTVTHLVKCYSYHSLPLLQVFEITHKHTLTHTLSLLMNVDVGSGGGWGLGSMEAGSMGSRKTVVRLPHKLPPPSPVQAFVRWDLREDSQDALYLEGDFHISEAVCWLVFWAQSTARGLHQGWDQRSLNSTPQYSTSSKRTSLLPEAHCTWTTRWCLCPCRGGGWRERRRRLDGVCVRVVAVDEQNAD